MKGKLLQIMICEKAALDSMLKKLDEQYKCMVEDDIFGMEDVVKKLQDTSKQLAVYEMERRKLLGECSMRNVINQMKDQNLERLYREIKMLLEQINLQKETNEVMLKQGLSYTNRMLNIINPRRNNAATYNSYGKIKR